MLIQHTSRLQLVFAFIIILFAASCFKGDGITPFIPPTEIRIEAQVPKQVYSNKKELALDASSTLLINGQREFSILWSCPVYPTGHPPRIAKTGEAYTIVDNLTLGKYRFHLRVQDNKGHEAFADYDLEVLKDTLSGAPKLGPLADQFVNLPQTMAYVSAADVYDVNPVGRDLRFSWSLVQQPAGSGPLTLGDKTSPMFLVRGLALGTYEFAIQITNEYGLSVSGTRKLHVLKDSLAGTSRIYDNLQWEIIDDFWDPYARIIIHEPRLFKYRSREMIEVHFWDEALQNWSPPASNYNVNDYELFLFIVPPFSSQISQKTKVQVKFL